jgi:hypothetical protein
MKKRARSLNGKLVIDPKPGFQPEVFATQFTHEYVIGWYEAQV